MKLHMHQRDCHVWDGTSYIIYRMSQKWRTNGALRCRSDYRKRQKNVKKILLNLFADLAVFESGT
jgi:hypothetical protein